MKKKKKKKLKFNRFIFILIVILICFFVKHNLSNNNSSISNNILNFINTDNYKTIKEDSNPNYSGVGQEKVNDKDGYFTTFTTVENNKKTYIEYKQNGNSSWTNNSYWGGTMEENGCGITALSIILSGYNKNYSPEDLRQKYYPVLRYEKMPEEISKTFKLKCSDFYFDSVNLSSKKIEEHLKTNRPIIICVWNNHKENRWTNSSHYMALLATDGNGMVYVSNPNGLENNSKSSGWYNFDEVVPYVAKALYIESYN